MATATLTTGFTVISTCDANTGWSAGTVDNEFFKQGTASLSGILRTVGLNSRTYTLGASTDLSTTHLRMWFSYAAPGKLDIKANGGIRLFMSDGTNTGYWYLSGSDVYDGGWILLTVDTSRAFDSGTCNKTAVTQVGFTINVLSAPRNATNTWWDYFVYGNGITITGGTSGDYLTWDNIATADLTAGYGAVRKINSVFFVNTNLIFGDSVGSTNCYFQDSNQVVVFEDQPVSSTLYKIEAVGSGTNTTEWKLSNTVVRSASTNTRFDLDLDATNLDVLTFDANSIVNADNTWFKAGQTITNSLWNASNQVIPTTATMTGCTFSNSIDTNAALLLPTGNTHDITDCTFLNNSRAIEITSAGTYTFDALFFNGNTYDIHNTSGGSVTVNATNGTDASTFLNTGGGSVTINNSVNLTLTGLVTGSEVRILSAGTSTELDGVESSGTSWTYTYNYTPSTFVDIVVHKEDYEYIRISNYELGSLAASIPISQRFDRNYEDPA